MSNYPPTPSFGSYNGYFQPPLPPSGPMATHPAYAQTRDAVPSHQQFSAPQIPYNNNAYAYNTNTQVASFPQISGYNPQGNVIFSPPPPFSHHGPYPSNITPPSPFHPAPKSDLVSGPRQVDQPIPQTTNERNLQPHKSLPPKPPALVPDSMDVDQEDTRSEPSYSPDREDGEWSDGEVQGTPGATEPSSKSPSRPFHNDSSTNMEGFDGTAERLGNTSKAGEAVVSSFQKPPSTQGQSSHIQSQHTQAGRAQPAQSIEQTGDTLDRMTQNIPSTQPSVPLGPRVLPQNAIPEKQVDKEMDPVTLREKSKDALRDMHRNNVGFEKLVGEGVDAHLLRELYYEIGIAIPSHTLERVSSAKPNNTLVNYKSTVPSADFGGMHDTLDKTVRHELQESETHISKATDLMQKAGAVNAKASVAPPNDTTKSRPAVSQSIRTETLPVKKLVLSTNADKALERKDYIAKMLAAKTGKSVVAAKPAKVDIPSPKPEVKDLKNVVGAATNGDLHTVSTGSIPTSTDTEKQADLEAKRKAQTELARRKIQALRNRTEIREVEATESIKKPGSVSPLLSDVETTPPPRPFSPKPAPIAQKQTPVLPSQPVVQPSASLSRSPFTPSFFSTGLKPGFSIPGLFTSSSAVESPKQEGSVLRDNEEAIPPLEKPIEQLPSTQEGVLVNTDTPPMKRKSPTPTPTPQPTVPSVSFSSQPILNQYATVVSGDQSRKRPTASDFIDYSPAPTRRRLDSDDHVRVLIEVSEDEDDKGSDDMDMDDDTQGVQSSQPSDGSARARAIRDLPPLSDFPSRVKPQSSSAMSTPSLVQTPSKLKEQEQLKLKEEQILAMQRKIAEMERRRRAKQDSSRAQSPSISNSAQSEVLVNPDRPAASLEKGLKVSIDLSQSVEAANRQLAAEKAALSITESNVNEDAQVNQEVAHHETSEDALLTDIQRRHQRKIALETALPELDAQVDKTRNKLENLKREMRELELEIQRGVDGRRAIQEELDNLVKVEIEETKKMVESGQPEDQSAVGVMASTSFPGSTVPIQSEMNALEEPRSDASIALPSFDESEDCSIPSFGKLQHTVSGEEMDISSSSSDEGEIASSNRVTSLEDLEEYQERNLSGSEQDDDPVAAEASGPLALTASQPVQQLSGYTHDDQRHGGVANELLEPSAECDDSFLEDHDKETTELPPAGVSGKDGHSNAIAGGMEQKKNEEATDDVSMPDVDSPINMDQEEQPAQYQDDNDLDDYEPPEPVVATTEQANTAGVESEPFSPKSPTSLVVNVPVASISAPAPSESVSDLQLNSEQVTASLSQGNPTVDVSTTTSPVSHPGHFTPYESPLKMFKSFRYHPLYISQVPGGFKSLTYSHKIDLVKPLCPWESAGGICNDDSCKGQHFRDMTLTDNLILIQMTSARKDSTDDEANIFKTDLREVVQDMRLKGKKDFDSVAAAIAVYRSKPFANGSKGLIA